MGTSKNTETSQFSLPAGDGVPTPWGTRMDTKVSTLVNPVSFWEGTAKFAELRL